MTGCGIAIRMAQCADADGLAALCVEHAVFERAEALGDNLPERLRDALTGEPPLLVAWVATDGAELVGYATVTVDFSTWAARRYVHMDCLYVRDTRRSRGIGAQLLAAVVQHARALGLDEVQWQTPSWNGDAQRFYERHGAIASDKKRFRLAVRRPGISV